MSDNNEFKKQPLPDTTNAPNSSEGSSSGTEPSAPQEQNNVNETVATTSPPRPPPPAAGFVCPPPNTSQSAHPTQQQFSYDVPPPSYQTAMSYPAAPTYGGTSSEPTQYSGQAPKYYQAPPQPVITQTRLPQPIGQSPAVHTVRVPAGGVVVVQSGPNCRYCQMGVVARHNDTCCLLCLIILTIFTFPFGLVFLCCIPCTVQNRCTNCHRLS